MLETETIQAESKAEIEPNFVEEGRRGIFALPWDFLTKHPDIAMEVLSNFLVVEARSVFARQVVEYEAFAYCFEKIPEICKSRRYQIEIEYDEAQVAKVYIPAYSRSSDNAAVILYPRQPVHIPAMLAEHSSPVEVTKGTSLSKSQTLSEHMPFVPSEFMPLLFDHGDARTREEPPCTCSTDQLMRGEFDKECKFHSEENL